MRFRPVFLLAVLALAAPSAALAASFTGTARSDRIRGTAVNDLVDVVGGGHDRVSCGTGVDVVTADKADVVARDCEVISRRISVDTLASPGAQHQTEVEPSAFGWGSTVVTSFQVGRFADGGAAGIGWATSKDAGRTWQSGILPGVTAAASPPGSAQRASDPAVAYDAAHGQWLVATLIIGNNFTALGISRSADGVTWSSPVLAANVGQSALGYDKEWVSCDNASTSRFYGSCYLAYSELGQFSERLAVQSSRDGGATWEAPVGVSAFNSFVGALPLVQPDGSLTVVFTANDNALYSVRSVDGGATFAAPVGISPVNELRRSEVRVPSLPTAAVDASGKMFVAWADCGLSPGCASQDVLLSSSADGATWTQPARVPGTGADSFVPGIAADPASPGRLALVTYVQPVSCGGAATCKIGVVYLTSRDGATTWTKPQRLDARPLVYAWLATTTSGRFVGDYVGAAFAGGRFVPTFVLAQPPTGGRLHEYLMAASLP